MSLHTIARAAATSPTERRPGPDWGWRHQGLCLGLGAADFFDEGERGRRRDLRVARAKATCAQCPVLERCREQALSTRERYGIWGGLTEVERERILATSDLEQAS